MIASRAYFQQILSRFGYVNSKSSPTPYDPSVILRKNKKIAKDQLSYSQIIGSLMYLASATRPDISFVVSKLSRFMSNPGIDHWHALERIMRYLVGTKSWQHSGVCSAEHVTHSAAGSHSVAAASGMAEQ